MTPPRLEERTKARACRLGTAPDYRLLSQAIALGVARPRASTAESHGNQQAAIALR